MRRALFGLLLATAACDEPQARASDQWPLARADLARGEAPRDPGEAAYRRTCIACHGADGKGNGASTGADFTAKSGPLAKSDEILLVSIREGTRGSVGTMPAHRSLLSDAEQKAVLAYVRRAYGKDIAVAAPGSASASVPADGH